MHNLLRPYRYVLAYSAVISFFLNFLLLAPSIYMMQVFDRVFSSHSNDTLFWLTLIIVVMLLFYLAVEWLRGRMMTSAAMLLDRLLGEKVLRVVLEDAGQPGFGKHTYLMRDVGALRRFVAGAALPALLDAPWLPLLLLLIYLFHPVLGLLAALSAVFMVLLALLNNRVSQKPLEGLQEATRKAGSYVDTSLRNAEVVHAMGMFSALAGRWNEINRVALRHQHETGRIVAMVNGMTRFSRQFVQVVMVAAGAYLVVSQNATPGIMLAATLILGRALAPVEHLIATWKDSVEAYAAYRRLAAALDEGGPTASTTQLPPLQGAVTAERVSFALKAGTPPLIKSISFQLAAGDFLGLIGPSGSGKSSLLRLITGVWPIQAGSIRYDGAEISHWETEALGRQIGYLPQDIELFPGTVAENIARMAEVDSEAVIRAAQRAGAHDMILRLAKGYDTEVGAGGQALSGGQRQRIGLARALYGAPRVVILDEPNSNLDAEGEAALAQVLRQLKAEAVTLIVVSHRRPLLAEADQLLVLKDGAVALYGPAGAVQEALTAPPSGSAAHVA
jgi:PrtD family type I secretion system ABC transporter